MTQIMSKWIYLSYSLSLDTPVYGGGDSLKIHQEKSIETGDSCNSATWCLPNHLGTHVDAPRHFYDRGKTIDEYPADFWVFCHIVVIYLQLDSTISIISSNDILPFINKEADFVLIKTGMHTYRDHDAYWEYNPGLSPDIGYELRKRYPSVRALGIDSISVSSWKNRELGRQAHRAFLNPEKNGNPILLIEDMDLSRITPSTKIEKLFIFPLRVESADASPCTVIAEVVL